MKIDSSLVEVLALFFGSGGTVILLLQLWVENRGKEIEAKLKTEDRNWNDLVTNNTSLKTEIEQLREKEIQTLKLYCEELKREKEELEQDNENLHNQIIELLKEKN